MHNNDHARSITTIVSIPLVDVAGLLENPTVMVVELLLDNTDFQCHNKFDSGDNLDVSVRGPCAVFRNNFGHW